MRAIEFIFRYVHDGMGLLTNVDREWKRVEEAYSDPSRVYHNLDHIEEMCIWLFMNYEDENDWIDTHLWILWAAIYHDIIDTKAEKAERRSANLSAANLFYGLPDDSPYDIAFRKKVVKWTSDAILATETHQTDNPLHQYLVDADLLRFSHDFDMYSDQIRQEYKEHGDTVFNRGRKAVLEKFAARNPFYYHCSDQLNQKALNNINKAIKELE